MGSRKSVSEYSFKSVHTESTLGRIYSMGKNKFQNNCSDLPWYHIINNTLSKLEQAIFAFTILVNTSLMNYIVQFLQNHPTLVLLLIKVVSMFSTFGFPGISSRLLNHLRLIYNK
eukprot:NODE_87_length_21935_cov_0.397142.p12 type:complete len:115 gc:universal NODE_87_length_21935_cov_0.397142:9354-9010(-)